MSAFEPRSLATPQSRNPAVSQSRDLVISKPRNPKKANHNNNY